jgi:hypothetical protein
VEWSGHRGRRMSLSGKRVLLTSNGDEVSFNLALNLVKNGCRSISFFIL